MSNRLYDVASDAVVLRVHVQPGAGRDAVVGTHGDALKVRVAAPPVSGRANDAVVALLARELNVPAADLSISAGAASRVKRVRVSGMDPEAFDKRLDAVLEKPALPPRRR